MTLFRKLLATLIFVLVCGGTAAAADFTIPGGTAQAEFNAIVTEAGRLTAYRSLATAEPGGLTGFDIGVAITGVEVDSALWSQFIADNESAIAVPRIMVRKGLPAGIDIGAFYADVYSTFLV